MLESFLHDDRLLRFASDVRERANEELEYSCGLPPHVCSRLAQVVGATSLELKHDVMKGSLAIVGYLYMDALYQVKT